MCFIIFYKTRIPLWRCVCVPTARYLSCKKVYVNIILGVDYGFLKYLTFSSGTCVSPIENDAKKSMVLRAVKHVACGRRACDFYLSEDGLRPLWTVAVNDNKSRKRALAARRYRRQRRTFERGRRDIGNRKKSQVSKTMRMNIGKSGIYNWKMT